jgi:cytoskeletal protein RodZ
MKEIGNILREKREQMKVSLIDVHNAIKVQEKYLSAIEEGDVSVFFAEVYYKSFVRSYAKYLGFDCEELIERYDMNKCNFGEPSDDYENSLSPVSKSSKRESLKDAVIDVKKILIVFVVGVAIILLVLFLYLHKHIANISSSVEVEISQENEIANDQNEINPSGAEISVNGDQINAKQKLVVEAITNVWIRIDCDNKTVYEGTLLEGNKKIWEADKFFTLKIGYAPGIKVFFNDNQVDVVASAVQDVNTVILK